MQARIKKGDIVQLVDPGEGIQMLKGRMGVVKTSAYNVNVQDLVYHVNLEGVPELDNPVMCFEEEIRLVNFRNTKLGKILYK